MFQGSYPLTLDAKGRLTIPVEVRAQIAEISGRKLTVTRHYAPCLRLYPQPEWERMLGQLQDFKAVNEGVRRLVIGSADPVELDDAGRITVKPILRRAARLDRRVVLLGDLTRLELWDEDTYLRYMDEQAAGGLPESLNDLQGF
ncbi:MAG: division/cell wall cluster transcriptional repressor MraZ [Lautropia sp.]